MKAVILAAGEGSRMRPLTYARPKVMLPIVNKPILEHLVIGAREAGITDFIFIVGYCQEQVRAYFGNGRRWGVNIVYRKQSKQLGTADAVRLAEGLVEDKFLVLNGDIIVSHQDIKKLAGRRGNTMSLIKVEDTTGLGTVELDGRKVARIHEKMKKPPSRLANAGVYLFTPEIFGAIARTHKSPRGEYELTDSLQMMVDNGPGVFACELSSWLDLSYPWDLLTVNESLMKDLSPQNDGEVEANVVIKGAVRIGKKTVVRSGAYIIGPVIIGEGCEIGPNCFIRPGTAIGNNCHVGNAVEVKNSIVMNGTKIPHLNYVGDSVIGEGCNLGAGTKIANLRLDGNNITVGGINTGRRKLGAIIGDGVKTGINASINIGASIGSNSFIGPGVLASGVIEPGARLLPV